MALRRWHRAGVVAAAMALVAVVVLPPRPMPEPSDKLWALFRNDLWYGYDRASHEYTLSGTLARLRARHLVAVMAESLLALSAGPRAVRSADGALTVIYESPLTADSARVWLRLLQRELDLAPAGSGRGLPVIVALASRPRRPGLPGKQVYFGGQISTMNPQADWWSLRFVLPSASRPACFVAYRLNRDMQGNRPDNPLRRDRSSGAARTTLLDWCLLYARFGVPGARVERWLSPRLEIARWWASDDLYPSALETARHGVSSDLSEVPRDYLATVTSDPLARGCARGASVLCLKSVGLLRDPSAFSWLSRRARPALVATLMMRDPRRFERFWRSDEAPEVAIERAYGQPAGDLIAEWRRATLQRAVVGDHAPLLAILSSAGWAALATGLALMLANRRQVSS